jgi:hypothetical protein
MLQKQSQCRESDSPHADAASDVAEEQVLEGLCFSCSAKAQYFVCAMQGFVLAAHSTAVEEITAASLTALVRLRP